jgi:hypothetical protein
MTAVARMERSAIRGSFANGPNKIPSSPERKIEKMPLSTRRAPKRGAPRGLFASKGQMAAHLSPRVHSA